MKKLIMNILILCAIPSVLLAEMKIGEKPEKIVLSGEAGGLVKDGSAWDSSKLVGKVNMIFYVDPDEKGINDEAVAANKADNVLKESREKYNSIVVINMDATWLPNAIVKGSIEDSQEENPRTIYVLDYKEALVKKWNLATDSYDIVILDKEGRVAFSKDGTLSQTDIKAMLKAIHNNL